MSTITTTDPFNFADFPDLVASLSAERDHRIAGRAPVVHVPIGWQHFGAFDEADSLERIGPKLAPTWRRYYNLDAAGPEW